MRLPEWLPGVRAHRTHVAAWAPELTRDAEGFTVFARNAEAAVLDRLARLGVSVASRRVGEEDELAGEHACWVELALAEMPVRVYIYGDQVDVIGGETKVLIEQWDAETPEAARRATLAALERAVTSSRKPAAQPPRDRKGPRRG